MAYINWKLNQALLGLVGFMEIFGYKQWNFSKNIPKYSHDKPTCSFPIYLDTRRILNSYKYFQQVFFMPQRRTLLPRGTSQLLCIFLASLRFHQFGNCSVLKCTQTWNFFFSPQSLPYSFNGDCNNGDCRKQQFRSIFAKSISWWRNV